ncbi:MAG: glycosyl hydrolase family protein [Sphingobacteriales bacterium]|nr:MAG: glycosyl hydrolase family protein [Sphingobacteriales bacterium]
MKQYSFLSILLLSLLSLSCGKDKGGGASSSNTPSDLQLNAVISTDNSGNVTFTATATNTVAYEYDYGNGVFQTVANGTVTYRYPTSGSYTVKVLARSSSGQTISKSIQISVTVALSLIWAEEFETAGAPNPSKWGFDIGAGGWGNAELQYYTNSLGNASVSDGMLKITAKKENFSGSSYTSARLLSKDKFSFKYGKVEARAKLPAGGGTWPAIWMLGNNINSAGWPACGEIDIMEHKGNDLNRIFGTLHYPGRSGGNADGATTVISNATTDFHIYTLEWTSSSIKISVDNTIFYTFANNNTTAFNQNFFFIINLAMGGTFGGQIDPAFNTASLEIDYIRVYQ